MIPNEAMTGFARRMKGHCVPSDLYLYNLARQVLDDSGGPW